ncbi:MAG: RluA family pseudouridine synthase [Bacilli bacterium]|nr:RluA family pseudouridine synthase [Bacilli bacterium]
MKDKLDILYEDNHIVVVVKPANILSQADNTNDLDMLTIIKEYIKEKYNKPGNVYLGLVHRLDRPVGGVMVFAKTSKAASRLSNEVRNGNLKKKYYAIVNDNNLKDEDTFIDYLLKDSNYNTIVTTKDKGKYAELSYKVLERDKKNNLALVDIDLKTGRHHQIRVQFASRGHVLYGDQRYGKEDKKQIALFAYSLEFSHPTTKEVLKFSVKPNGEVWNYFRVI